MLLGKRPAGPPIRRTSSLARIIVDPTATIDASQPSDKRRAEAITAVHQNPATAMNPRSGVVGQHYYEAPRKHQKAESWVMENNDSFLRTCSLCFHHLRHNRDIYMYRGNRAFCSLECREKQMKLDEGKAKNGVVSSKKAVHIFN